VDAVHRLQRRARGPEAKEIGDGVGPAVGKIGSALCRVHFFRVTTLSRILTNENFGLREHVRRQM
jgi:hypothetical protein